MNYTPSIAFYHINYILPTRSRGIVFTSCCMLYPTAMYSIRHNTLHHNECILLAYKINPMWFLHMHPISENWGLFERGECYLWVVSFNLDTEVRLELGPMRHFCIDRQLPYSVNILFQTIEIQSIVCFFDRKPAFRTI